MKGLNRSKLSAVLLTILAIASISYLATDNLHGSKIPGLPEASAQLPTPCPNISTDTVLTYSCVIDSHYSGITINQGVTLTINPHVTITSYNNIFGYGNIINYGTISVQSGGNLYVFSSLTNYGTITLDNFGQLANDATLLNYGGTITNNFSGVTNNGVLNNNGTVTNNFGTFDIGQEGVVNNKLHGIFTNTGNLINNGIFNNGCGAVFTGSVLTNPITYASCDSTAAAITPNPSSASTGSSLVFNATITDTSSSPTTPTGMVSWTDGSAGGKFANSATCTLSGSGSASSCAISYTAPLSAKSVVITGQYAGDLTHSSSSVTSHLTIIAPDTVAPTTTATLAGTAGTNGWYTSQVTATLAAVDNLGGSGVKSTSYSLDGGPQTVYTVPISVTGNGMHTFAFYSDDNAGNIESQKTLSIKIDNEPPTVSGTVNMTVNANGWYNHPLQITWAGTDTTSGVASCDSPTLYSGPDGSSITVTGHCTDESGNVGIGTFTINYDSAPPVLTIPSDITVFPTGASGAAVTFSDTNGTAASATDATSGIDTMIYSSPSGSTFPIGTTTVTVTATDKAGNMATGSFKVMVQTPVQASQQVINSVTSSGIDHGTATSLDSKLQDAISSLESGNANVAKNQLNAFINEVNAQAGKKITTAEAAHLVIEAQNIINSIS